MADVFKTGIGVAGRWRRITWLLILLAAAFVVTWSMQVWLRPTDPVSPHEVGRADAVVVFLGGDGERVAVGIDLVRAGVAPVLVLGVDPDGGSDDARHCRDPVEFEVVCVEPEDRDTGGEARMMAAQAERRGWDRLVVVTADYHLNRAALRLRRCGQANLATVPVEPRLSPVRQMVGSLREWLAHIEVRVVERSC